MKLILKATLGVAVSLVCLVQSAHAIVQPVNSQARTSIFLQTCATLCLNAPFEFNQTLWRSQGAGDAPTLSAGFYPTPNGATQFASAQADLAQSQLHVVYTGRADDTYTRLYGAVAASIGDTLFIAGGSGQSRLSVDTTGTFSAFGDPADHYASVTLELLQPGSLDAFARGDYDNVHRIASVSQAFGGSDWGSPSSLALPGTAELVFDTPASPFEWSVTFASISTLTGQQSINLDLGHTLTVHFDAPVGAQFISASGYVPSATGWVPTPAVPEPQTVAMLLIGLAVVGVRAAKLHQR